MLKDIYAPTLKISKPFPAVCETVLTQAVTKAIHY